MAGLSDMFSDFKSRVSKQHFGPGQSVIWSTINDPKLAAEKAADWLNQSYASAGAYDPYSEAVPEKSIESALGLAGLLQTGAMPFAPSGAGTLGSIKASHGSPHSFEKFLMSKLGTGEGAQAYGHGLYFGEGFDSPVAKQYRDVLSPSELRLKGGGEYDPSNPEHMASATLMGYDGNTESAIRDIQNQIVELQKVKADWRDKAVEENKGLIDLIKRGNLPELEDISHGNLYNVELRWPDAAREAADPLSEEHFLQWDRPISEQPENVRNILTQLAQSLPKPKKNISLKNRSLIAIGDPSLNGGDAYFNLGGYNNPGPTSQLLREAGIPGIRYLDQGSRGAGQGTHNYVVFDENIPNIVSRNGVSLSDLLRR